jgi:chromosomal replication initiation ATPase DnaA
VANMGEALAKLPAIKLLIEKYGPVESWTAQTPTTPSSSASTTCERCQDQGYLNRPEDNPNASVPIYRAVPCPDCHEGRAAVLAQTERRWDMSGISVDERQRCTFPGFALHANPQMAPARNAALAWGRGDGPPFVVLTSSTRGLGKTHLAIAAAGTCIDRGQHVFYAVTPRFLDRLRATFGSESTERLLAVRGAAEAADALVLDDLGAGKSTEWADEQLFSILDWRWSRRQRTLLTTNLQPDQLEERIASRICDRTASLVLACAGRDYRLGGAQ